MKYSKISKIINDAKNKERKKIRTKDLTQMLSYANFLHTKAGTPLKPKEIILLYPDFNFEKQPDEHNFKNNINANQTTKISQRCVNLSRNHLNKSLHEFLKFLSTKGIRTKPFMSDSPESCECIISNARLQKIQVQSQR